MGRTNNKVQLTWLTWSLCATYLKVINYVPLSYLKIRERIFLCHFLLEWIDSKEIMNTDASVKMGQWCCFSIFSWHYCVCFSLVLRNPMTPPWTFPVQLIHALPWIKCDHSLAGLWWSIHDSQVLHKWFVSSTKQSLSLSKILIFAKEVPILSSLFNESRVMIR